MTSSIIKDGILFISRKNRHLNTGIGISAQLIVNILNSLKLKVYFVDSRNTHSYLSKQHKVNLIWIYDDGQVTDTQISKLSKLYNNSIPILFNSTFNNDLGQTKIIIDKIKNLGLYMVVFSNGVINLPHIEKYKNNLIVIPKTIKIARYRNLPFNRRKDICIGDINKLLNSSLNDNLNVYKIITCIKEQFPDINLHAFKHHIYPLNHTLNPYNSNKINTQNEIEKIFNNVKIHGFQENLTDWLGNFRIYISLINKETFSMVPVEAQSVGTVVFYRNMPQSLNEYISNSGYMWDDIDDLINAIKRIYYNKDSWTKLSELSLLNYKLRRFDVVAEIMLLQLEKVVIRHKKKCQ